MQCLFHIGFACAAVGMTPAEGVAQPNAPIVRIWPRDQTLAPRTASTTITIDWCADQYGYDPTSRKVTVNRVDVTANFTPTTYVSYTGCVYQEKWTGTIQLSEGQNTVDATVRGANPYYAPVEGFDRVIITVLSHPRGIAVVPGAQYTDAPPNTTVARRFSIANTGDAADTALVSVACTANTTPCTLSPGSVIPLGARLSTDVTVYYPASAANGTEGLITLTATSKQASSVKDSSWTMVTVADRPPAGVVVVGTEDVLERDLCVSAPAGTDGAYECGDLRLGHELPGVSTINKSRTPVLLHNSQHASPYVLMSADVTLPANEPLPATVEAVLTFSDGARQVTRQWSGSEWGAPGETRRITVGFDASTFATDLYQYQLVVRKGTGTTAPTLDTRVGQIPIVNRQSSPFGAGWWLAGLEELRFKGADLFWVGGDGSTRLYRSAGTSLWLATSLDRADSIVFSSGQYWRKLPNGTTVRFNAGGQHIATVTHIGHFTNFSHTTAGGRSVLDFIRVPSPGATGLLFRFRYNPSGQLIAVEAPGAGVAVRTTTLTPDAATGRIASIADPDGLSVLFGYDPTLTRRIASRTNRRNITTTFSFDAGSRLIGFSVPLSATSAIASSFRPAETMALAGTANPLAQPLDSVFTKIDGPRADVPGVASFWLNRYGAPVRIRNPLGHETQIRYDAIWPARASFVRGPNRLVSRGWYNPTRGLIDSMAVVNPLDNAPPNDTVRAMTRYTWDAKWDKATSITTPRGVRTSFAYDPVSGTRTWQQIGSDPARRVSFLYYTDGWRSHLLAATRAPLSGSDSVYYDEVFGNVAAQRTPLGFRTEYASDAFGRDTLMRSPIDAASTKFTIVRTTYDLADRVRKTVTIGPAMGTSAADSVVVEHQYDNEGNKTHTNRRFTLPSYVPTYLSTSWTYDDANRVTAAFKPEGGGETFTLDPAGNVTRSVNTRGQTTTAEYDALNRVVRRVVPQVPGDSLRCPWTSCNYWLPTIKSPGACIDADTAVFAYDVGGNMTRADNGAARIRRTFTPSGLMASDQLSIRTYSSQLSTPCAPLGGGSTPPPIVPPWPGGGGGAPGDPGGPPNQQSVDPVPPSAPVVPFRRASNGRHATSLPAVGGGPSGPGMGTQSVPAGGTTVQEPMPVGVDADFSHSYLLRMTYDLDGRRTTLEHPANLSVCPGTTCPVQRYDYDPVTGALSDVTDVVGVSHAIRYDSALRVKTTTSPGWSITRSYDLDGRMTERSSTTGADALAYDAIGRVVSGTVSGPHPRTIAYQHNGLGGLTRAEGHTRAGTVETSEYNALGSKTKIQRPVASPSNDNGVRLYENDATGQLHAVRGDPALINGGVFNFNESYEYRGGNLGRLYGQVSDIAVPDVQHYDEASWYGADNKLRVFNRTTGLFGPPGDQTHAGRRPVYEEYRYDALGRRVVVRSRREKLCPKSTDSECRSYLDRIVWDGSDVLYEIRAEGSDSATSTQALRAQLESDAVRVAYTHLLGIDAPASVIKLEDAVMSAVVPHADWQGVYEGGNFVAGTPPCPTCPQIDWPGRGSTADGVPLDPGGVKAWYGSLLASKADGSGQQYMRNRYYDPKSGRFTQVDPIGLAGGLNLYGYANGDPVSYSDPFGLCPPEDDNYGDCAPGSSEWYAN